jgi:hypothetical protein
VTQTRLTRAGLILFALTACAPGPAEAQTIAPGPYYAMPSWDQSLACATLATCPRFVVLSGMASDAVLDRETGLVWERSPSAATTIFGLVGSACNNKAVGNRKGWRVPAVQELASLIDPSGPLSLPPGHPFENINGNLFYWTATSVNTVFAWAVSFDLGAVSGLSRTAQAPVWCVRGGPGGEVQ